ncbi:low-density lipoprotein receptor-related protein 6-like [Phymastichus coffea]|uniref:low-density lipoprotein receptor-related protein 6-like n=1 Tax=Phymastichus coffea TaxID=108790 RepID=UPI00273B5935|nr:low-density lipoprotein receptor-related protein 6-like [Phymastichus coffea]
MSLDNINNTKATSSHEFSKSTILNRTENFSQQIIINDENKLWVYNIEARSLNLAYEATAVINSFEIDRSGETFLTIFDEKPIIISFPYENLNSKSTDFNIIFEEARIKPRGIAFDYMGEILYIVDESIGCLIVADVHTKQYNILLNDLLQPVSVSVDPQEGVMFILQISHSVLKGNMNGENIISIIEGNGISAFTMDYKLKRLYWVDDFVGIKSSDYSGKNQFTIATITSTIVDLSILNNQLFWLWQDHHNSSVHQLLSCKINANSCHDRVMYPLKDLRTPVSIKSFTNQKHEKTTSVLNPCKINKGKCQDICLISSLGTYSCACKLGWQLNPDERTCRESRDFILYVTENLIRGHILDGTKKTFTDVILPTTYRTNSSKYITSFDYDQRNDNFYFAEDRYVYRINLKQYKPQKLLFDLTDFNLYHGTVIINLAFDWLAEKLYYFRYEKYSTSGYMRYYIKKYKFDGFENVRYFDCKAVIKAGMIIHPQRKYMFYIGTNDSMIGHRKHVERISLNATISSISLNTTSVDINLRKPLTIDYQENRLYWIEKNYSSLIIKQSNLDGLDVHQIILENLPLVDRIFIYRQWIYLVDNTTVWRVYKKTGKGCIKVMSIPTNNINGPIIDDIKLINDVT